MKHLAVALLVCVACVASLACGADLPIYPYQIPAGTIAERHLDLHLQSSLVNGYPGGSLVFAGADGYPAADAAHLFWGADGRRLGIGLSDPDSTLDVNGAITAREVTADPADPDEGASVCWVSDGSGSGQAGETVCKATIDGALVSWFPAFAGKGVEWNDVNIGGLSLGGPAVGRPVTQELLAAGGVSTGIYTLGFAVNENGSGVLEIPHGYQEGSAILCHVHWSGNTAPSGTDAVAWSWTVTIVGNNAVIPAATTLSVETAYSTAYERVTSGFPPIDGTGLHMGDQLAFTLKRIPATGDAYAGTALLLTAGCHFAQDTVGSRGELTK